jgi:hypothetical protein
MPHERLRGPCINAADKNREADDLPFSRIGARISCTIVDIAVLPAVFRTDCRYSKAEAIRPMCKNVTLLNMRGRDRVLKVVPHLNSKARCPRSVALPLSPPRLHFDHFTELSGRANLAFMLFVMVI